MSRFNVLFLIFLIFSLGCVSQSTSETAQNYKILIERLTKTEAVIKNTGTQTIPANNIVVYVGGNEKCKISLPLEPNFSGQCTWVDECTSGQLIRAQSSTHSSEALCPA